VGVDGSTGSQRALEWAIRAAVTRDAPLRVVTVWACDALGLSPMATRTPERARSRARGVQDTLITRALSRTPRPHPQLETDLLEGDPASLLVEISCGADLLVLGSRSDESGQPDLLGSVADVCVRHADCPVVVVPCSEPAIVHDGRLGRAIGFGG
jgi:nucleotide-binding universal stress UspA family protein